MKATEVTADLAESNGSLLPGLWRDSLQVTCGLTACTPGSAPGPTLGNEYGKTLHFFTFYVVSAHNALLLLRKNYDHRTDCVAALDASVYSNAVVRTGVRELRCCEQNVAETSHSMQQNVTQYRRSRPVPAARDSDCVCPSLDRPITASNQTAAD